MVFHGPDLIKIWKKIHDLYILLFIKLSSSRIYIFVWLGNVFIQ